MKGRERAELRAEAHHLKPTLHVGQHGITDAVAKSLDDVLRTHELVKCQVLKDGELTAKEAAATLASRSGAEVVQVIGRTFTLHKHNPELHEKAGALPPWRR
jgi:RNA-binding protein